jgi:hypothetical protein
MMVWVGTELHSYIEKLNKDLNTESIRVSFTSSQGYRLLIPLSLFDTFTDDQQERSYGLSRIHHNNELMRWRLMVPTEFIQKVKRAKSISCTTADLASIATCLAKGYDDILIGLKEYTHR